MLKKLEKYWDLFGTEVEMNTLVIVATVFDPTKKMKFAQLCFEKLYGKDSVEASNLYDSIMNVLRSLFNEYNTRVNKSCIGGSMTSSQSQGASSQSQEQYKDDFSERIVLGNGLEYESMNDIYKELVQESDIQEKTNELDLYLKEGVENPNLLQGSEFDVLFWWRFNNPRFPVMSLITRDILAMQVSSLASESAFRTSGRVLDPSRSCLTHYTIEVLMCVEQWLKCEIKINERGVTKKEQILADIELQDDLMRGHF